MSATKRIGAVAIAITLACGLAACSSDAPGDDPTVATESGSAAPVPTCGGVPAPSRPPATTAPTGALPKLSLTDVATVTAPTAATTRCDEHALYVTEQAGIVKRVPLDDPTAPVGGTAVLDISDRVVAGGEQGLLGIAFAPDGASVFLAYTNKDQNQELDKFTVNDTGAVDAASRTELLTIPDFAANHNGGQLLFDESGYLYWGMGDGGNANDGKATGQDPSDLLGNIVRIDPFHPSNGKPYGIPSTNPFAGGGTSGAPEVFVYGLRNPWRFSIDALTGDLWIADVGQNLYEEIDRVAATDAPGANFGWNKMEGTHAFNGGSNPAGALLPVYDYDHTHGCAVVGGDVYRGTKSPGLVGSYLFGDYCTAGLKALQPVGDGTYRAVDLGIGVGSLSTFAQDVDGELYALSLKGNIVRLSSD